MIQLLLLEREEIVEVLGLGITEVTDLLLLVLLLRVYHLVGLLLV